MAYINPNRHLVIRNSDEATLHRNTIEAGSASTYLGFKHLTLIFDSNSWDDWEDDVWGFFLRAYTPLSSNLQSLNIDVHGDKLFTAENYIRPMISYSTAVPAETSPKDSEALRRRSGRAKKNTSPTTLVRYCTVDVPLDEIVPHIYEKSIVAELLRLNTPIPMITITGPMQMDFRARLIKSLNPHWRSSPHCVAQCGGLSAPQVAATQGMPEMVSLPTDWDVPTEMPMSFPGLARISEKDKGIVGHRAVGFFRAPDEEVESQQEESDVDNDDNEDSAEEEEDEGDEDYTGAKCCRCW